MAIGATAWEAARRGDLDALLAEASPGDPAAQVMLALAGAAAPPDRVDGEARTYAVVHALLRLDLPRLGAFASAGDLRAVRAKALLEGLEVPAFEGRRSAVDLAVDALATLRSDVDEAVELARKAVLMARADGFVFDEYFTSLALARARRHAGHAHLATRILRALEAVAPSPWHGWLGHEAFLAHPARAPGRVPWSFTTALREVVTAASAGDAATVAEARVEAPRLFGEEVADLLSALRAREPTARVAAWLAGRVHEVPAALAGFAIPELVLEGQRSSVMVRIAPDERAHRILRVAMPLFGSARDEGHSVAQERSYRLLAELAFAPEGLSRAEVFERIYGFAYRPAIHGGTFRVLLHRARAAIEGEGHVEGEGDVLRLVADAPAVFPDPRSALDLEGVVLNHLARTTGAVSARDIAGALQVSVRSVHRVLRELQEQGLCEVRKEGRKVRYELEDTTFHQPTLSRLRVEAPEL